METRVPNTECGVKNRDIEVPNIEEEGNQFNDGDTNVEYDVLNYNLGLMNIKSGVMNYAAREKSGIGFRFDGRV